MVKGSTAAQISCAKLVASKADECYNFCVSPDRPLPTLQDTPPGQGRGPIKFLVGPFSFGCAKVRAFPRHGTTPPLAPSLGPFSFGGGVDDEDWVERYREEFQKRSAQKEMEERTLWRRTKDTPTNNSYELGVRRGRIV
jgi:hypothetical protein